MSTIPFTPIQGYLAMPRLRPFGQVPASFGRDWALLPPGYSLRAELKALYAAMLRTFCMSDQAIRSLCRWSPSDERRAGAAPAPAPAPVFEKPFDAAAQMAAAAAAVPPVPLQASATAARGFGHRWSVLAGGACVLGGAAMLGWIGFEHLMHRDTATNVNFAGTASGERDSRAAKFQSSVAVTARAEGSAAAGASAAVAAAAPALHFAPAHGFADKAASHRRKLVLETSGRKHEHIRPRSTRFAAAKPPSHASAIADDMPRSASPNVAARVSPKPSAAGHYSPLAPARLGVDEYAGITMSAATHVRDIAPMPRTGSSNNASGGTDWMNHLSQRRVTDIPDQFAK